jgi:hypothetical protein
MEKHVRKLRGLPAPAPRPSKFNTTLKQHQRGKLVHNLKWGFPPKKSAIDPDFLAEHIRQNGPYMYHGATEGAARSILDEGLYPHDHGVEDQNWKCPNGHSWSDASLDAAGVSDDCPSCGQQLEEGPKNNSRSQWSGSLEPRSEHVYLGTHKYSSTYGGSAYGQKPTLLKVDLRKLNHQQMNADEDHFSPDAYQGLSRSHQDFNASLQAFDPPPVDDYDWHPGESETLGAWADRAIGGDPEATRHSMTAGSMAYNGHIPPEAVSLWQPGDEARPETPEAAHAGWDLSQDPGAPGTSAPMQVAAGTDSNHFEAKMYHGSEKGMLRGSPHIPLFMTDHQPEAIRKENIAHPMSVRFKNPVHYFADSATGTTSAPTDWLEQAMNNGNDGVVVHHNQGALPKRTWGIALDPGTVVPGHDHEFPY